MCWLMVVTLAFAGTVTAPTALAAPMRKLYVSPSGNDSNAGTSGAPLRTLAAAALRVKPGTTVMIAGGTYYEQLVTKVAGSVGKEITFQSYNGTAVIDGSKLGWRAHSNQNQAVVELRHPYVRLKGLKIVNSSNTGVLLNNDNLTVEGCEIAQTQWHAISTETSRQTAAGGKMIKNILIKGNDVHDTSLSGDGQVISLIADGFVVSGNKIHDNKKEGIDIWLGAKHGEVVDNELYRNSVGIFVDGASYVRVHRNRAYANVKAGIGVSSEDTRYDTNQIWVYNNLVYDHPNGNGCFIWDPDRGPTNVLFAHNTLANNKSSFYLSGQSITATILNNLGYATGTPLINASSRSTITQQDNIWLTGATDFANAAGKDFRLKSSSTAIDKVKPAPSFSDDQGHTYSITTDFLAATRTAAGHFDAGAFERP
jgi:hypothetical protein